MKKYVTKSVQVALPEELIEDIFALALTQPETDVQTFYLNPGRWNGRPVENVEHTVYRSSFSEFHKIFDMEPVEATVSVCFDGIGYNMFLADYKVPEQMEEVERCNS